METSGEMSFIESLIWYRFTIIQSKKSPMDSAGIWLSFSNILNGKVAGCARLKISFSTECLNFDG
jgi:hypothetical protein